MTTNKKIIICTLLILTMFSLVSVVSASESPNDNLEIGNTNNNPVSAPDSPSSLSDTDTSTKTISSNVDNDKQITTETAKSSSSSTNNDKTANNDKQNKSSSQNNNILKDGTNTYVSPTGTGSGSSKEDPTDLDTALTNAIEGSTIYLSEGTYERATTFTLDKSLIFIGDKNTILKRTGNGNIFSYTGDDEKTFSFNSLIFKSETKSGNPLINMGGSGIYEVTKCKFTDITVGGTNGIIKTLGNAKVTIDSCEFYNLKTDGSLRAFIIIMGNSITNIRKSSFHDFEDTSLKGFISIQNIDANADVSSCKFYNIKTTSTSNNAIIFSSGSNNLTVSNCTFENNELSGSVGIITKTGTTYANIIKINTSSFQNNKGSSIIYIQKNANAEVKFCAFHDITQLTDNQYAIKTETANILSNYNYFEDNTTSALYGVTEDENTVYIVKDGEIYKLSNGESLTVTIPSLNDIELPAPAYDTIYVNSIGGNNDNNGSSEDNALADIITAITKVQNSGTIIILPGTYIGHDYEINKNLTITGQGDVTLDAQGLGRLFNIVSGSKVTLNNLKLINGNFQDANDGEGGAIYVEPNAELTVDNCEFINNTATHYGGAISSEGKLIVKDSSFDKNNITLRTGIDTPYGKQSTGGAAILVWETGSLNVENCNFTNHLEDLKNREDGIFVTGTITTFCNTTILNSNFTNNKGIYGGAITVNAPESYIDEIIIDNCEFINNRAYTGGAINIEHQGPGNGPQYTISNCLFENNKVLGHNSPNYSSTGGAITIINNPTKGTIINNIFRNNSAIGGLNPHGGAIILQNTTTLIKSCTFENNTATLGGAIYTKLSQVDIEYNILTATNNENIIYNNDTENNITANYNWWGNNNNPNTRHIVSNNVTISNWAIMNVEPTTVEKILSGRTKDINVDFTHYIDSTGNKETLSNNIPELNVKANAANGELDNNEIITVNNQAKFTYTATTVGSDLLNIICGSQTIPVTINVVAPNTGIVYVSKDGDDENEGLETSPVKTINRAIEIATAETGSGKISILEGTYSEFSFEITKDLEITGNGAVVIDGNSQGRLFTIGSEVNTFKLTNLVLTGAKDKYGSVIYSNYNAVLILDNITLVNDKCSEGYNGMSLITNKGNLTIKNSIIANNTANGIINAEANVTIINSVFENNNINFYEATYGLIYLTKNGNTINIESSNFTNNTARQSLLWTMGTIGINIKKSSFVNNTNDISYGGILRTSGTLNIEESEFINNRASRDGGAIYVSGVSTIIKSRFINNTAGTGSPSAYGDAIYNSGQLTINYSVLLTNGNKWLIINDDDEYASVNAQFNYWGTNDNPKNLVISGTYEDWYEDEYQCTPVDVSNWVIMNVEPTNVENSENNFTITVDFKHYIDSVGNKQLLQNTIPEITVTATADIGELNTTQFTTNTQVDLLYTVKTSGTDTVNITSGNLIVPVTIENINIVTPETLDKFFDEYGNLKDTVPFDELTFKGEFKDQTFNIGKSIKLTGKDAIFNNTSVTIIADNVKISNIQFVADTELYAVILSTGKNTIIENNNITYNAPNTGDSYAIYLDSANNSQIIGNIINYTGKLGDNTKTIALFASNTADLTIKNNVINATIPSKDLNWIWGFDEETYEMFMYVLPDSAGISIDTCKNLKLENNNITVQYNDIDGDASDDSLYGIGIHESNNAKVTGNNIKINAHKHTYGIVVDSAINAKTEISGNNILVQSDDFQSNAIDIGGVTKVTIKNNNITAIANKVAYPIVINDMNHRAETTIQNNNIKGTANIVYGIYSQENEATINKNNIDISGNYTIGVVTHTTDATIKDNIINSNGTNNGTNDGQQSSVPLETSAITSSYANVEISGNSLKTTGNYTIHGIKLRDTEINNNQLIAANGVTGDASINLETKISNDASSSNIITPKTLSNFFDTNGVLKSNVLFDELIFKGEFKDKVFTINRAITLTGNDALFNNTALNIAANNVKVTNITFVANKIIDDINSVIYTSGHNTIIENNNITYTAPNTGDAYAIFSDTTNGLQLLNNNIKYIGTLNETNNHRTIPVYSLKSNNQTIDNNNIIATIPSIAVGYDPNTWESMVLSSGILLENCENTLFTSNNVSVQYDGIYGTYNGNPTDTIYGVKISGDNNQITANNIELNGHTYTYGLFTNGNNITIKDNTIKSDSDSAYAAGMQIDTHSTANIENNDVSAKANNVTYGIYSEGSDWMDANAINNVTLNNNKINIESNTAYGVMLNKNNAKVTNNEITTNANHTNALSVKNGNATINNNKINSNGTNTGISTDNSPMAPIQTTGIYADNANINITNNEITTTSDKTIDLNNCNGTIKDNKLKAANGAKGDETIKQTGSNVVIDNNKTSEDPVTPVNPQPEPQVTPQPTPSTQPTPSKTTKVSLVLKKVKSVSKKAKKLVLRATLKINGKKVKGKKITFIFRGKKFTAKTNKKGTAKVTIKKAKLRKLLKKVKTGKKIVYKAKYGKKTVKKYLKVKK